MRTRAQSFTTGTPWYKNPAIWLAPVPILSVGILSWVPALYGFTHLRRRELLLWALMLVTATVVGCVLVPAAIGGSLLVGAAVAGTLQSVEMRLLVPSPPGARPRWRPRTGSEFAVAQVESRRIRRADARRLISLDPAMARELGIGCPHQRRYTFDDGGVVDLNHADAIAIADVLGLDSHLVGEIIRARTQMGGLVSCDELGACTDIPADVVEHLRERAVFVGSIRAGGRAPA